MGNLLTCFLQGRYVMQFEPAIRDRAYTATKLFFLIWASIQTATSDFLGATHNTSQD